MQLSTMLNPVSQVGVEKTDAESDASALALPQQIAREDLYSSSGNHHTIAIQRSASDERQHDHHVPTSPSLQQYPGAYAPDTNFRAMQMDGGRSPKPRIKVETLIKTEPAATPRENSPASAIEPSLDEATMKAIKEAQNEYSTRRVSRKPIIDRMLTPEPETPKPAPSKKRPAAKTSSPALDGAPAGMKKPPPKKCKVEHSEDRNTPKLSKRSSTPSSTTGGGRGGSKQNNRGGRKSSIAGTTTSSSPAVVSSPAAASETASDVDDNGEVYCICRRPDNHTFMIACDGGCDDWFHGKCVNIQKEDENLIDKYICPNCTAKEVGVTTWKPMCRREGCRKPARLRKGAESKYCTDDCGVAFMKGQIRSAAAALPTTDHHGPDEEDLGPLGGPIRTHELKALVHAAPDYETFRRLGSSPLLTPPPSSPSPSAQKQKPPNSDPTTSTTTTAIPQAPPATAAPPTRSDSIADRLSEIAIRKAFLRARHATLKDRERLVVMVKERATRLVAAMKAKDAKTKDVCGYDGRLSWDDATFADWRQSDEGQAVFAAKTLDPPEEALAGVRTDTKHRPHAIRSNTSDTLGGSGSGGASSALEGAAAGPPGVCMRKRCQRHNGWQKLALHDVRFEEADVGAEMRRVGDEEVELRAKGLGGGGRGVFTAGEEEGRATGWVEVVGGGKGRGRIRGGEGRGVNEVDEEGDVVFSGVD